MDRSIDEDDIEGIIPLGIIPPKRGKPLCEHYCVKPKQFNDLVADLVCKMLKTDKIYEVLDEEFKELQPEGRLKVVAYYVARNYVEQRSDI